MNRESVVIIIPTYNESECIENTIHEVFSTVSQNNEFDFKILIFDSHSTDQTQFIVKKLQKTYSQLILKSESEKSGLGSAYRQAMQIALDGLKADIVFEFDADLSHQPKYLMPMLDAIKEHDVVIGSRYVQSGSIPQDWGFHRKLLSRGGNLITRCFLTQQYKDFTSGFRATRRHALAESLPSRFISNGYAYKVELLWRLHKNRFKIKEIPIDFINRKQGYSKLPTNTIKDTLSVIAKLRLAPFLTYIRMCMVGLVGLCIQLLIYNLGRFHFSPFFASLIAASAAITNNYILNSRFTFKIPCYWTFRHKLKSFGLFVAYNSMMVFGQSYWTYALTKATGQGFFRENMVVLTGIILGSILNYLVYSKLIWEQHKLI